MFRKTRPWAIIGFAVIAASWVRADITMPAPASRWELEYTTGVFWNVGGGATPLSYTFVPQILTLKIPPINERPFAGGTLIFRSRFSLLIEPIIKGPEHSFLGVIAAGDLEWRAPSQRFSMFLASGGGFGGLDSKGYDVPGGQGQDFNLTWLIHSGLRYRTRSDWWWSLGLYFQHISNRNMNKVNPGVNALGPTLGLARKF